jgi:hypothetical protein
MEREQDQTAPDRKMSNECECYKAGNTDNIRCQNCHIKPLPMHRGEIGACGTDVCPSTQIKTNRNCKDCRHTSYRREKYMMQPRASHETQTKEDGYGKTKDRNNECQLLANVAGIGQMKRAICSESARQEEISEICQGYRARTSLNVAEAACKKADPNRKGDIQ